MPLAHRVDHIERAKSRLDAEKELAEFKKKLKRRYKYVFDLKMPDLMDRTEPSEALIDMLKQADSAWAKIVTLITLSPPEKRKKKRL